MKQNVNKSLRERQSKIYWDFREWEKMQNFLK